ncbi:MAG: efflux RND transporter periplasmic adaptor subunit, partial [Sphingomonas sp.]
MNYETRAIGNEEVLGLPSPDAPRRGRTGLIIGIITVIAIVAAIAYFTMGRAKPVTKAVEQLPLVSVVVPGRSSVARVVSATGSLAARREMPIGVAGDGGMVTRVLVEPGQWVAKGQVLALVDRSVQT